ncbi:MAG TPA: ankyrin repeat domain-containing protein [Candidatus Krumholzibacteria bacterium]|nr:ankyrin repeat domain-containing protein [Candidatus Krumholzibacteria bacterium]
MPHEILRAIRGGDSARVREILERDPSAAASRDADGVSAILLALHHRANEALDLLLREDPDLDVFEAAALGRTDQLRRGLREDPSRVAARAGDGFTPLHLACFFAHLDAVDLLIDSGADVNVPADNESAVRPLHSAAAGGDSDIVGLLLRDGASVNARQARGHSALHAAAAAGNTMMARRLLEHGADPDLADDAGRTPVDLARESGHDDLLGLLEGR